MPWTFNNYTGKLDYYEASAITTVVNSDGTVTVSPTVGNVVVSLNLGHANTWTADQSVPDEVFGVAWNGSLEVPTKNALYDVINPLVTGSVSNVSSSDGTLTIAPNTGVVVANLNLSNANTWLADQSVPDEAYGIAWNGSLEVPTKNAIYDVIQALPAAPVSSVSAANATLTIAPTTGAVLAELNLSNANTWLVDQSVPDEAYGVGWNGSLEVPTKNALYDKIETIPVGDVVGPASATDNAIARYDGATGKIIQNSVLIVDDTGNIVGPAAGFKITGGTGTTADLTFQTTSGIGATGADMHFLVGNNGATEAMTIFNNATVAVGSGTPTYKFEVYGTLSAGIDSVIRANSGADYVNIAINPTKATGQANVLFQKNGVLKQQMGMDFANAGTADFYWYDQTLGTNGLYFNTSGDVLIGSSGTVATGGYYGTQIITAKASTRRVGINATTPQRTLDVSATGQITFGDGLLTTSTSGLYWYSGTSYGIYRSGGAWAAPDYAQLTLKFATGIVIDGSGAGTAQSGTSIQPTVGNVGIGMIASLATARLHLAAGTATAGTAPLKFNSGTLLTTAAAGAVEFLTDKFYGTITTGAARKELTLNDAALTSGRVPFATTNGRLTDDADFTFATDTLTVTKVVIGTSITTVGGTAPVADGTYTVGARLTGGGTDGTITTKSGIITAITQAT